MEYVMKRSQSRNPASTGLPYLSALSGLTALTLFLLPDAGNNLQYDRTAIADGELWRIFTAHWIHWSFDHFLWCTVSFVALGVLCERLNRKTFILSLALSMALIPAFTWVADPDMMQYRGMSGLCSCLFIVGCLQMMRQAQLDGLKTGLTPPLLGILLFLGKILYEFISGQAIFVDNSTVFTPVPLAHLAGCIVGLATVFLFGPQWRKQIPTQTI